MKTTISEPETWKKIIDFEIPDEDVQKDFQKKLEKYKREIKLPGFRKGKVPSNLVKSRFGKDIRAEAIEEVTNNAFKNACTEHEIQPVSNPVISDLKADDGKPVTFSIAVEVDPEIEITGYKKLKIKASPIEIKDSDVDIAVDDLKERLAQYNDLNRPAEKGDFISLLYLKTMIDGEEQKGFQLAPMFEIGKGPLKDFDEDLIGMEKDQEKDISIKLPENYYKKEVAGKNAVVTAKVKKIREKILPEINDDFLKKVGDFSNEEDMRTAIQKDLEVKVNENAKKGAQEKAIDKLIEKNKFEVPPARIDQYITNLIEEQTKQHPANVSPPREEIEKLYTEIGIRAIKRYRIIEYIVKKEKIKATQEEVDNRIKILANHYGQPFDQLKNLLRKNGTTTKIRNDLREEKTLACLIGEIPWENK